MPPLSEGARGPMRSRRPWLDLVLIALDASDLMTISLNRAIEEAINLYNVLVRWIVQKKHMIPC